MGWLGRACPVVGQDIYLPISATARAELVPLALVVVVVVPNVQVKQAPERLHRLSIAWRPVTGGGRMIARRLEENFWAGPRVTSVTVARITLKPGYMAAAFIPT